jgi:hypothetical protein
MGGKPQAIYHSGGWHSFRVSDTGQMVHAYGRNLESWETLGPEGAFAANADVTVARLSPGPPDNPYYEWIMVAADRGDGWADHAMMWIGDWNKISKADHWVGPVGP